VTGWLLGVCDGHDSGAALVDDGGALRFAVSEERLTRRKHQAGFPTRSIRACLEHLRDAGGTLAAVAAAERVGRLPHRLLDVRYRASTGGRGPLNAAARLSATWSNRVAPRIAGLEVAGSRRLLSRRLRGLGVDAPLQLIDHHLAHAWSAAAGGDDALVLTLDGFGDGRCGTVHRLQGGALRRLEAWPAPGGPALLFGAVAQHLGYDEGDEGKVVARAAAGAPEALMPLLRDALVADGSRPVLAMSPTAFVRRVAGERPDDVAAALQARSEELLVEIARAALSAYGGRQLLLAGGVFANVAINRALAEAVDVDRVFVFGAMGDSGLCAGAGWAASAARGVPPRGAASLRLGPPPGLVRGSQGGLDQARDAVRRGGVVARCAGPLEFGPRALGARSLLLAADDLGRAARLNAALGRDPVMPFGPVMTAEAAPHYLVGWGPKVADMTGLMTVALPATERLRTVAPAAVHADGTARAQVLGAADDPDLHALLSGLDEPVLINTSLNTHGEPIVCTADQAARVAAAVGAVSWGGGGTATAP